MCHFVLGKNYITALSKGNSIRTDGLSNGFERYKLLWGQEQAKVWTENAQDCHRKSVISYYFFSNSTNREGCGQVTFFLSRSLRNTRGIK